MAKAPIKYESSTKPYTPQEVQAVSLAQKVGMQPKNRVMATGIPLASPTQDYLRGIALMVIFGTNIDFIDERNYDLDRKGVSIVADLPFAISNLSEGAVNDDLRALTYNSMAQGVNDYSDKPYPVKGYLAVVSSLTTDWKKDMDNYITWKVQTNVDLGSTTHNIAVGFVNSSKTDFYTPFDGINAVFFELPKNEDIW